MVTVAKALFIAVVYAMHLDSYVSVCACMYK